LDRYRGHLLDGLQLTKKELAMLEKFRRANALLCQGYSKHQTVLLLMKEGEKPLKEGQAYSIIRDALKIYGDVAASEKAGMKHIMYENFMVAASLARKEKDYNAMIRAIENAAKVTGTYADEQEGFDLNAFMQLLPIDFTSNPAVLDKNKNLAGPDTYTDFEEIDDPGDVKEE
jgi:hypothetical protein